MNDACLPLTLHTALEDVDLAGLPWQEHPSFEGVALRHLLTGERTEGRMSAHLVRVRPGCSLGRHAHPGQLELHEVLRGSGQCTLSERTVRYAPGVCGLIPAGQAHSVKADDAGDDLYILAKFVPALL